MNKKKGVLIAVLVILGLSSMAFAGMTTPPYVQSVFSSEGTICFVADQIGDGYVWYGKTQDMENSMPAQREDILALWGVRYIPSEEYDAVLRYSYCAKLTSLEPGTVYYYQAVLDSQTSDIGIFTTAKTGIFPFYFVAYGDSREDPWGRGNFNTAHQEVIATMSGYEFDFFINVGDFVHDGFDIRLWETNIPLVSPISTIKPLYIAIGNHEDRDEDAANGRVVFEKLFSFPKDTSGRETYFSFDYSNCHFVFISSEEDFSPGSTQYNWIVSDLAQASSNPNIDFIFATLHRPPFTCCIHGGPDNDGGERDVGEYLVPLFEEYGVDIAFFGHEHSYERSVKDDVIYIIQGNGGAWPCMLGNLNHNPYGVYCEPNFDRERFGFGLVYVNQGYLKFESIITSGEVIDSFEIGTPPSDDDGDVVDDDTTDDDTTDDDAGGDDDDSDQGCGC